MYAGHRFHSSRAYLPQRHRDTENSDSSILSSLCLRASVANGVLWKPLEHLRSQGDDLQKFLLPKLTAHRAKHARSYGFLLVVDQHRGIVVESDVRTVPAPVFLLRAHYDGFDHSPLLDLSVRRGFLHVRRDDVSKACHPPHLIPPGVNARDLPGTRVVRHFQY